MLTNKIIDLSTCLKAIIVFFRTYLNEDESAESEISCVEISMALSSNIEGKL